MNQKTSWIRIKYRLGGDSTENSLWIQCNVDQIPMDIYAEMEKLIFKFMWDCKGLQLAKTILKMNKAEWLTLHNFKNYYKVIGITIVWYWHKDRHVEQNNIIECWEINPYIYDQVIFDKDTKTIQWGKNCLFNKVCWDKWTSTCKRVKLDSYLIPYTKSNSKWISNLNRKAKTRKLLEENIG